MNSFSITINKEKIKKTIEILNGYEKPTLNNKYIEKVWFFQNHTITLYKTNKLLIQGNEIEKILDLLYIQNKNIYEFNKNYKFEIGSDETGVGDFFGGIVVCAVKINKQKFDDLICKFKINDSKKLSDKYIQEIYEDLIKIVDYQIESFSPKQYNKFINIFKNSHMIKAFLHNKAISKLHNDNDEFICIDQFVNQDKYYEYLQKMKTKNIIKINKFETKAETKYLSVAIASIIARGWYLKQIKQISNKLSIELPLGSWNEKIKKTAIHIGEKYGENILYQLCKTDFKVFNIVINDLKNLK